jgi:hypothetical protein
MRLFSVVLLALLGASTLHAQTPERIVFEDQSWLVSAGPNGRVEAGNFAGRDALYISRAQVWRDDLDLGDVVIEYDIAPTMRSGFMGVNFRAVQSGDMEQFYIRGHLSGFDDATQYQPIHNGISSWQIYGGPNDIQATEFDRGEWLSIRIVAIGDAADIFVGDMETPLLHVSDLRGSSGQGAIGFFMGDRPWIEGSGAWISHVEFRPAGADDQLVGSSRETPDLPDGLMSDWAVSSPFAEAELGENFALPDLSTDWTDAQAEPNGVLNLARLNGINEGRNTVLVRTTLSANNAEIRRLRFGYSDRVRLYLNGEEIYAGNAGWRARDHRHLGTITWVDTVPLRLGAGQNELVAAVSESFGGWGFTAALDE